ncbi:MAG: reprolysin-like metallopeptidase [Dokdonella sp.]
MFYRLLQTAAKLVAALIVMSVGIAHATPDNGYWQDAPGRDLPAGLDRPAAYRALTLDLAALKTSVDQQTASGITLSLPRPDAGFTDFVLSDSGVMPAELVARYPQIRSYTGVDATGDQVRVDISPLGVNAMVFGRDGIWMVRPVTFGEGADYIAFRRSDVTGGSPFQCKVHGKIESVANTPSSNESPFSPDAQPTPTGVTKRTYRAAVVANHQWVQAYTANTVNPTVADGLAGVVMAVNRVDQVYQTDFAIHLSLVPNNDLLIFPLAVNGGVNDPFGDTNSNGGASLNAFTGRITGIIGVANYDIGHVFTTGSGGVAGLGVVCKTTSKGQGTTGLTNGALLSTDVFYIDYVAHEMGHQHGGNHTFNGSNSNCGGGNRAASAAYEPGSGSTIMAYAGICGAVNDLQPHSDPYFHAKSLDEINIYTTTGAGGGCGTTEANHGVPVVAALANYTIPANTPFALTGSATSAATGANLTYGWEEYDLGAANNNLAVDLGTGPIIRSFNPGGPTRIVPRIAELLNNTHPFGEILPTTSRALNFVLTVRDNTLNGGTSQSAKNLLTVVNTAGPFTVTAPAAATVWDYAGGTGMATVSWNVGLTDLPPVSCAAVNIDLIVSGNFASPIALASGVPNNGSATVNVPNVGTTAARARVSCANNIFFNISTGDFTVIAADPIFASGFDLEGP